MEGRGFHEPGFDHLFVVPADGGTARQLTQGSFHHNGRPAWTPDGRTLLVSANRRPDWAFHPLDTDLWMVDVASGRMSVLASRYGPDNAPAVSPDGRTVAVVGYEDKRLGFQPAQLRLIDIATGRSTPLAHDLDRRIRQFAWAPNGRGLYAMYDDQGNTKLIFLKRDGQRVELAANIGGTTIGRPYASGSFSIARSGKFAFTTTRPAFPADIAVGQRGRPSRRLTHLNEDSLGTIALGKVEAFRIASTAGQVPIQGWMVKPPDFDPKKKYPLLLEIHGGPFANYGDRFSAECQLYAAAGYVVVYVNPRGSTSYGEDFANLIHHNYPNEDYDDLMTAVDHVVARGFIDTERLFVTGGSGGGVLTAWIVGKTSRFRAAVVAKPVINWTSFVLTADRAGFFHQYWFSGLPWDKPEEYRRRSPLYLAGNVSTPTMVLTGEADYRTPTSEAEQFYLALKLRKVETMMVRIPGAS
ncbi:MAG: S9 family peptidase, partial [Myxococcota bacterium]